MEMVHRAWGCRHTGWRKAQVTLAWGSMQQEMGRRQRGLEMQQVVPWVAWRLVSSMQVVWLPVSSKQVKERRFA